MIEYKQVIIMRTDLGMRRGKQIAQGAHATLGCLIGSHIDAKSLSELNASISVITPEIYNWLKQGMKKVCVQIGSEEELLDLIGKAEKSGLTTHAVIDSGLTEFNGVRTLTCAAIGPNKIEDIDKITGHLKLL